MNNKQSNFYKIRYLIKGHTKYAFVLLLIMLMTAVAEGLGLSLVLPLLSVLVGTEGGYASGFTQKVDSFLSMFPDEYRIEALLAAVSFAFLCKGVLMILHRGMSMHFSMQLREMWSNRIFSRYIELNYKEIIDQKRGALINNIVNEPLRASKSIVIMLQLASKLALAVTLLVILLLTDWKITLPVACGGAVLLYMLRHVTDRYSVRFGKERLKLNRSVTAVATESISALREIKIFGAGKRYLSILAEKLTRYSRINIKFAVLSELPRHAVDFVVIIFIAVILSYIHLTRQAEFKNIFPLLGFFVLVSQRLLVYVSFIMSNKMKIASFFPSLDFIYSTIYEGQDQEESPGGRKIDELRSDILLKDVTFSYEENKPVFSNMSLTIPRGKVTAIVGTSGIGKSTIADLILRLFEPQKGKILVNGQDIRQFDLLSWRNRIGYVSQEPIIFNASVRENILIGNMSAGEDEVIKAAKMANIHDFIQTLSNGYDTVVGDSGVKLSGGQRQRLAIARVIIRDPEIYIFDEATSSLDRESERMIQASIQRLSQSKTILIIAHRISTLEKADIIYQLDREGRIKTVDYDSLNVGA